MLFSVSAALATTYMDVSAADVGGETGVRKVSTEAYGRYIGVFGDVEFQIVVSSSYPEGIDTCWIYLNGTTTTGTTRNFTATGCRFHYGIAVIKYEDSTYESMEFRVNPAWAANGPQTQAYAPTSWTLAPDATAAALMEPVAEADPDGDGPPVEHCVCMGHHNCDSSETSIHDCGPSDPNPDECDSGWKECERGE
jgi:hypothetical protein